MKREDLEKLGLTEEQVTSIMKLKSTSIGSLENKIETLTSENVKLQGQITDANKEIQSYKDMDIESIKKSADDWETKYNELTESQKLEKEKSIRDERINAFFNDIKFASESAKTGVIAKFNEKDFKYDEETMKYQGADEWLKDMQEKDKGAFLSDIANPTYTATPTAPTKTMASDEIRQAMGLKTTDK